MCVCVLESVLESAWIGEIVEECVGVRVNDGVMMNLLIDR